MKISCAFEDVIATIFECAGLAWFGTTEIPIVHDKSRIVYGKIVNESSFQHPKVHEQASKGKFKTLKRDQKAGQTPVEDVYYGNDLQLKWDVSQNTHKEKIRDNTLTCHVWIPVHICKVNKRAIETSRRHVQEACKTYKKTMDIWLQVETTRQITWRTQQARLLKKSIVTRGVTETLTKTSKHNKEDTSDRARRVTRLLTGAATILLVQWRTNITAVGDHQYSLSALRYAGFMSSTHEALVKKCTTAFKLDERRREDSSKNTEENFSNLNITEIQDYGHNGTKCTFCAHTTRR